MRERRRKRRRGGGEHWCAEEEGRRGEKKEGCRKGVWYFDFLFPFEKLIKNIHI